MSKTTKAQLMMEKNKLENRCAQTIRLTLHHVCQSHLQWLAKRTQRHQNITHITFTPAAHIVHVSKQLKTSAFLLKATVFSSSFKNAPNVS